MHQLIYLVNGPENFDLLDELNLPFPVPNNKYTSELLFNFSPSCTKNFSFHRHLSTRIWFQKCRFGFSPSFIYAFHTDWLWAIYFCLMSMYIKCMIGKGQIAQKDRKYDKEQTL